MSDISWRESNNWEITRRRDGAFLVRVPSTVGNGRELPDAVFTFRAVDPQYSYWEQRWQERKKMRDEGMIDT